MATTANALLPSFTRLSGNVTDASEEQKLNASSPISVTPSGITMDFNDLY
jgi:hypothetical protein